MNKLKTSFKMVGVIQILLILVLAAGIVAPIENVTLLWEDFGATETSGEYISEGRPLKSGAYTVEVCYDVLNPESNNDSIDDILGKVDFHTFTCPAMLHANSISLNSQSTVMEQTIWVDFGAKISDFKVRVTCNESKNFQINSIGLSESREYRVVRLLGFLILFGVIDVVVSLLLGMHKKSRTADIVWNFHLFQYIGNEQCCLLWS